MKKTAITILIVLVVGIITAQIQQPQEVTMQQYQSAILQIGILQMKLEAKSPDAKDLKIGQLTMQLQEMTVEKEAYRITLSGVAKDLKELPDTMTVEDIDNLMVKNKLPPRNAEKK